MHAYLSFTIVVKVYVNGNWLSDQPENSYEDTRKAAPHYNTQDFWRKVQHPGKSQANWVLLVS